MDIWVAGTSNQPFIRGFKTEINSRNRVVTGKPPFFVIDPFCTPESFCLNIGL